MSRKRLTPKRRDQIIDALETCIRRDGLSGVSLDRVAEEAGVEAGLLADAFGTLEVLLAAAIGRRVHRHWQEFLDSVVSLSGPERTARSLDYLFGGAFTARPEERGVTWELLAMAARDAILRVLVRGIYTEFTRAFTREVALAYPHAPEERHVAVAYAIVCLAEQNKSFVRLGFDRAHHAHARAAAEALLATLEPQAGAGR